MFLVFVGYSLYGLQFHGPSVLSDEGGYLTKALALTGTKIDFASSWQGGYPILISPIFRFFSDPDIQWRLVVEANALMWAISAGLLFYMLRKFFPKKSNLTVALAVVVSLIFPGCISMTGLAYATSAFVLVLMMALAALIKSKFEFNLYLIIFALLAGYLFWIHPTGIVFILAVIIYFVVRGRFLGNLKIYLIPIAIMLAVSLFYFLVMRQWFNEIMTPDGVQVRNHYDDFVLRFTSRAVNPWYWIDAFGVFIGQFSFLLVSTFGIVELGAYSLFSGIGRGIKQRLKCVISDMSRSIMAIIILSVIGVSVMAALYFPADQIPFTQDQWLYGRYVEMFVLPLIGVGLLSVWKLRPILWSAGFVLFNGIFLSIIINESNTILYSDLPGKVDTGLIFIFWPVVSSAIIPFSSISLNICYLILFIIGCLGIMLVGYVILKNKKIPLIALLIISLLALNDQVVGHAGTQHSYSGYSSFVEMTKNNFKKGSCVGFSDKLQDYESYLLNYFRYYLHEYNVERMGPNQWLDQCNGPYLSYEVKFAESSSDVKIVARDKYSGLYIVMRNENVCSLDLSKKSESYEYILNNRYGCKVEGCLNWSASSGDPSFTQVGEYQNNSLHTTGREGYLFIGPKVSVDGGTYRINMKLNINKSDSLSRLKIVGDNGKIIHRLEIFDESKNDNHELIFQLREAVDDLQIMIYVGEDADITLSSYSGEAIRNAFYEN